MTVELTIEKNVYGGDALARLADGRVVFVPGAFAGECVRATLVAAKKRFVRARLEEVLTPSPDRRDPGPVVPGMVYAPLDYAAELRLKQDQLENFLWKVHPSLVPLEVVPAPAPFNYRNKVVYHTEKRDGLWHIGYRAEPSHEVVDVETDPLACAAINKALPEIRRGVRALLTQGARAVRESARAAGNVTIRYTPIDGVVWYLGDAPSGLELTEQTLGARFRVSGDGFYQVNPAVAEKLVAAVRAAYLAGASDAPQILDLYCGVGVFGLSCAAAARASGVPTRLVGVESGRAAVACARRNAADQGLAASFFCERVGSSLGRIKAGAQHTVILDPPRGGLEPGVAAWLARRGAPHLFYVSCDPATLTRDLAALLPRYRIHQVTLFDMFPRTARFETLVELVRA